MTTRLIIAVTVAILAISAFSTARAQTADDDAAERVLRASGVAPGSRDADAAECGWLRDTSATGRPISSTTDNSRKGSGETNAAPFENAWKLYHRLGATYAAAGNTKLAIRCYEKSVTLNPEDEAGQAMLARLLNQDAVRQSSRRPEH
jgi:tetratricopeptide (TPR) repeat protein